MAAAKGLILLGYVCAVVTNLDFGDFLFSHSSLQICSSSFKLEHFRKGIEVWFWLGQYRLSHYGSVAIPGLIL